MVEDWIAVFGMFFVFGLIMLATIIIVIVVWQSFETKRARMSIEREEAYRQLAEQATDAQNKMALEEQKISEGVDELRTRVAAIEKILREVD
jgi:hypothetical protein